MVTKTADGDLIELGYQQLNTLSTAIGLAVPAGATIARIQARDQAVRWRDDATSPTAAVGMVLASGGELFYAGANGLAAIEFIEIVAGAELNVSYYAA